MLRRTLGISDDAQFASYFCWRDGMGRTTGQVHQLLCIRLQDEEFGLEAHT